MGPAARLVLTFAIALSLLSLPSFGMSQHLPNFPAAYASIAPTEPWYPAGPAMDTLTYPVFTDSSAEFNALQQPSSPIDFTDWPLSASLIAPLDSSPAFQVTSPISDAGYYEPAFHMGQHFCGCQFTFGNAACGTHIRQAFAHGMDKNVFVTTELSGQAVPIDNPVPPSVTLNSPNPCNWDAQFPQTGSNCIVNGQGGTAYHLATATTGGGCTITPAFSYTPGCGTPDFCAAADHMIAAGLATGKNPSTASTNPCVLTGIAVSAVTANSISIFVRSDNTPRLHAGNSYAQFICALFTGAWSTGCGLGGSSNNVVFVGQQFGFPGFGTSTTTVALTWWVYTAGYGNVLTFDSSLFFSYDSRFVSGISTIKSPSGPCSAQSVPTSSPTNYMYLCSSSYDANVEQAEFAPCLTAPGDPSTGQTHLTVTFANCQGTSSPSSASAAYKAQDIFGQNAFTIPWWSGKDQFAYLTGWQRAILHKGDGFTPPGNFFLTLNAWNPSPPVAGTLRQGYKQGTGSVNPFISSEAQNLWGQGIVNDVWDVPGRTNPDSPQAYLDWMTIKTDQLAASGLSYVPQSGTVAAFRYTLRNDLFWHTGQKVTAWDLAFSYIALKATGASLGSGLAPITGVKVLSQSQVDVDVSGVGLFTKLYVGSTIVFPGRVWSSCGASTWDTSANKQDFTATNTALTPCIGPNVSSSGVLLPSASAVDISKISPTYDPVAAGTFIGS